MHDFELLFLLLYLSSVGLCVCTTTPRPCLYSAGEQSQGFGVLGKVY